MISILTYTPNHMYVSKGMRQWTLLFLRYCWEIVNRVACVSRTKDCGKWLFCLVPRNLFTD